MEISCSASGNFYISEQGSGGDGIHYLRTADSNWTGADSAWDEVVQCGRPKAGALLLEAGAAAVGPWDDIPTLDEVKLKLHLVRAFLKAAGIRLTSGTLEEVERASMDAERARRILTTVSSASSNSVELFHLHHRSIVARATLALGNTQTAKRILRSGIELMRKSHLVDHKQANCESWHSHFRGLLVECHVREGNFEEALRLAREASLSGRDQGSYCDEQGFSTVVDMIRVINRNTSEPANCLSMSIAHDEAHLIIDVASFRITKLILRTCTQLRMGKLHDARISAQSMLEAHNTLCEIAKQGPSEWEWLSPKVLRCLVLHLQAMALRHSFKSALKGAHFAEVALGMFSDETSETSIRGLYPRQSLHLHLMLLESCCRFALTGLDLVAASKLLLRLTNLTDQYDIGGASLSAIQLLQYEYDLLYDDQESASARLHSLCQVHESKDYNDAWDLGNSYMELRSGSEKTPRSACPASGSTITTVLQGLARASSMARQRRMRECQDCLRSTLLGMQESRLDCDQLLCANSLMLCNSFETVDESSQISLLIPRAREAAW
eukprot:CAMPEP_0184688544 /NCGR_PEP_ID=MMETSP0312-20130426/30157_1 /TAXON_ID=31354 /ORGANISM="Compsopogon coeruleus, Strain SAG 36.94" /LENGTH=553 /DNA_ID=CAMNT_0027145793 /DNA_START=44 /DNA_END=1703 /DNA_ORIENTATION=-